MEAGVPGHLGPVVTINAGLIQRGGAGSAETQNPRTGEKTVLGNQRKLKYAQNYAQVSGIERGVQTLNFCSFTILAQ